MSSLLAVDGHAVASGLGEVVHRSELATVVFGDAREVLGGFATESFDLTLTDPPYGVEWQSNMRAERFDQLDNDGSGVSDRAVVHEVLRECVRLTGQRRHMYVFGPSDVLDGLKVSQRCELIWDKGRTGMGDLSLPWGPAHEPISFVLSLHRHGGKAGSDALPVRMRKGSVLRFVPPTGRNVRHPSEKPVGLLRELIESSSKQGELVLDPFAGSGSTGVAAILAGRRCVLVESDRRWCDLAVERVRAAEATVLAARSI